MNTPYFSALAPQAMEYYPYAAPSFPTAPPILQAFQSELAAAQKLQPTATPPCCSNPSQCNNVVGWQNQFKNCAPSFVSSPKTRVSINRPPDRIYVGDLNPLQYERSIMCAAEPNFYEHLDNRVGWLQFLWKDMNLYKDKYTKPLTSLKESYALQSQVQGPPAYTQF